MLQLVEETRELVEEMDILAQEMVQLPQEMNILVEEIVWRAQDMDILVEEMRVFVEETGKHEQEMNLRGRVAGFAQ